MSSIYEKDWYRGVVFGLIMIGIAVILVGGALFIDATLKMQNNYANKVRSEGSASQITDESQARVLMVSDLELRELTAEVEDPDRLVRHARAPTGTSDRVR